MKNMYHDKLIEYEGRILDLHYDWQCGNWGFGKGFVSKGKCYEFWILDDEVRLMHIPDSYVVDLSEPRVKVTQLESSILESIKNGQDSSGNLPISMVRPIREA
jgi:hypothetical protein